MTSLTVAFVSAIGVGVVQEILVWNLNSTAQVDLALFALVMVVLLVRVAGPADRRTREEQSTWLEGTRPPDCGPTARSGSGWAGSGSWPAVVVAALLPFVLSTGRTYLLSQICIYAVIALSMTVLTGWAGQVSLGQFGLVAVGALLAAHLGSSVPLVLLLPLAGAVTAVVAIVIGLPALRVRGLYLAVSTLAFNLWFMGSVLGTPCWALPLVGRRLCTGLPNAQSTLVARPEPVRRGTRVRTGVRLVLVGHPGPHGADGPGLAGPRRGPPAHGGARQRDGCRCHGHPHRPDQAAGLCALRLHRRVRRCLPRLRHRADLAPRPSTRPTRCWSSPWW